MGNDAHLVLGKGCGMCFKSLTALLIHREELQIPFNQLWPLKTKHDYKSDAVQQSCLKRR